MTLPVVLNEAYCSQVTLLQGNVFRPVQAEGVMISVWLLPKHSMPVAVAAAGHVSEAHHLFKQMTQIVALLRPAVLLCQLSRFH